MDNLNDEVLFEEMTGINGNLGIITLNRPQVLNSLNHSMIKLMYAQLNKWELSKKIKAVIIKGVGDRAFCAGGDLRKIYSDRHSSNKGLVDFFKDEYELNKKIYHFTKPYIALLDGITMGGGVGISIHGSHRVATERTVFAMPETGIGFFPDVGGTFFLPRLNSHIGFYLGLVGAKLACDDCVNLGLAGQKVSSAHLPDLIHALAMHSWAKRQDANNAVTLILEEFREPIKPLSLPTEQIDQCFAENTIESIVDQLEALNNDFTQATISALKKKSPTSLKVTLQAFQHSLQLTFDKCITQELVLSAHFLRNHDFEEGIRAAIIDKDHLPQWQPKRLEDISKEIINGYFSAPGKELV